MSRILRARGISPTALYGSIAPILYFVLLGPVLALLAEAASLLNQPRVLATLALDIGSLSIVLVATLRVAAELLVEDRLRGGSMEEAGWRKGRPKFVKRSLSDFRYVILCTTYPRGDCGRRGSSYARIDSFVLLLMGVVWGCWV